MEKKFTVIDAVLRFAIVAVIFLLGALLQTWESSLY